jgi:hypothetical protein
MNLNLAKRLFLVAAIAAVCVSVAVGLKLLGSPSEERARKLDDRRVEDLQRLATAVDLYRSRAGHLPSSLEEVRRDLPNDMSRDPVTEQPYGYRLISVDKYELCADFQRASEADRGYGGYDYGGSAGMGFWSHPAGHRCFESKSREAVR